MGTVKKNKKSHPFQRKKLSSLNYTSTSVYNLNSFSNYNLKKLKSFELV